MILGVIGALAQTDIRRMLGFLVISGIGVMLAGLALGNPPGISGTILYAVHSMLVMTALYLLAGTMRDVGGSFSLTNSAGSTNKPVARGCRASCSSSPSPACRRAPACGRSDAGQSLARCRRSGWLAARHPAQRLADDDRARPGLPAGLLEGCARGRTRMATTMRSARRLAIYAPLVALAIPIAGARHFSRAVHPHCRHCRGRPDRPAAYIRAVFPAGGG